MRYGGGFCKNYDYTQDDSSTTKVPQLVRLNSPEGENTQNVTSNDFKGMDMSTFSQNLRKKQKRNLALRQHEAHVSNTNLQESTFGESLINL